MNVSRSSAVRLVLALATVAIVLVIGTATALGQGSSASNDPSTWSRVSGTGPMGVSVGSATTAADASVASGSAVPAWCCGTSGAVPGLTTVGQATVSGRDQAARDAAIASAVQDATAQANAAAEAAGIHLGPIIDMQVSAMPYFYPMTGVAAGSPGSSGGGSTEPAQAPNIFAGSVSVTITWSLS